MMHLVDRHAMQQTTMAGAALPQPSHASSLALCKQLLRKEAPCFSFSKVSRGAPASSR